ncbi:MAG: VCBS repeat-containing protein [Pseudomonadota bacterium]
MVARGSWAAEGSVHPAAGEVSYAWASSRIGSPLWGMAFGDIDGTGRKLLLLERGRVLVGKLGEKGFEQQALCDLPGRAEGARIYTMDLDGDGVEEIVVSAVEEGLPASLALSFKDGKCRTLFERERWSLRVIEDLQARKTLTGQSWSSDSFFFGPVFELKFEGKKLKKVQKIGLPTAVNLFQFAALPGEDERLAVIKGYQPLEVYEKMSRRFKRTWRTGVRFGGGLNILATSQRAVLGEEMADMVEFNLSPLVSVRGADFALIAPRHDMPLKGFIGRRPSVHGATVVEFRPDPALFFEEISRTINIPGAIVDYVIGDLRSEGKQRLFVLMQDDPSMFKEGERSIIFEFEMP